MNSNARSLDVLFVSELGLWPPDRGFRMNGCQLARTLHDQGISVAMASMRPTKNGPDWLTSRLVEWPTASQQDIASFHRGWAGRLAPLRRRLACHQAMDPRELAGVIPLVKQHEPKVLIGLGHHAPLFLRPVQAAAPRTKTVWYAANEPVSHQLWCLRRDPAALWTARLRLVGLFAGIEWLFARRLDGAIGASPADTRALLWLAGANHNTTIRSGVDLEVFDSCREASQPRTVVYWGRMDDEQNVDAVTWFANNVWPALTWRAPDCQFFIVGPNPTPAVKRLRALPGVVVTGQVDDIRPYVRRGQLAVMPLRSWRGGKTKMLEAAAMGRPIIASRKAERAFELPQLDSPICRCDSAADWIETVWRLWNDPAACIKLGHAAHRWAASRHTWPGAAAHLVGFLNEMLPKANKIEPHPVDEAVPETLGVLPLQTRRRRAA